MSKADDWQYNTETIIARDTEILKNELWTDCSFLIENKEVKCHRLYLAKTSSVFAELLYEKLKGEELFKISLPGIRYTSFMEFLLLIYTGYYEKFEEYYINCDVLALSKKYQLSESLLQRTRTYLFAFFNSKYDNPIKAYTCAVENNIQELSDMVLKFIGNNQLKNRVKSFICFTEDLLIKVVQLEEMRINEIELFKLCIIWGKYQLMSTELRDELYIEIFEDEDIIESLLNESIVDKNELKIKLKNILPYINISGIDYSELSELFDQYTILPKQDEKLILQFISSPNKYKDKLPKEYNNQIKSTRIFKEVPKYIISCAPELCNYLINIGENTQYFKGVVHFGKNVKYKESVVYLTFYSQILSNNIIIQNNEYEENYTVIVTDEDLNIVYQKTKKEIMKYNSNIKYGFRIPREKLGNADYFIYLFHHISGIYPYECASVERYQRPIETKEQKNIRIQTHLLAQEHFNLSSSDEEDFVKMSS